MWPYAATLALLVLVSTLYNRSVTGETTANYRVGFILEEFDWMRFTQTTLSTLTDVIPVMLGPIIMLFLGVGLFMVPRTERRPAAEGVLLAFILTQWFVSLFVLSPAPRYLMAPIIGLTFWAAAGIVLVMRRAVSLRWGKLVAPLPLLALVGFMLVGSVQTLAAEHVGQRPRQPREYKTAGIWIRENLEPGLIFTRKPQIAWYAQMPSTGPALEDDLAEALARGTNAGAAYLVVDERYTTAALRPLLDPDVAPDSLEHLATFEDIPNAKVILYRFKGAEDDPAE
jgi:hypothetical protein